MTAMTAMTGSIGILKKLEGVRKRPEMDIGDTATAAACLTSCDTTLTVPHRRQPI